MLAFGAAIGVAIGPAICGAPAALAGPAFPQAATATVPGAQLWVSTYNGPADNIDFATDAAVSPGGGTVFVTGVSDASNGSGDYATVAYDASSGAQRWASRYNGPGNSLDLPFAIAVSPDGATIFVTGESIGASGTYDYATIGYSAATGAQLWISRYNGPNGGSDVARSLAVSPDGRTVYVTGYSGQTSGPGGGNNDYVTIAYNADSGAQRWLGRYNGRANGNDQARSVAVSPDGRTVYVTGRSQGRTSSYDYATVDYNAATGAQRWVSRYNGSGHFRDSGRSLAVAPDGRTVIVTGSSWGFGNNGDRSTNTDYATIAYNTATGAARWIRRYAGTPDYAGDDPASVAVSPGGGTVFVTGTSWGGTTNDFATVAYSTATGARQWVSRYNGPGNSSDGGSAVVVSPGGGAVYVTGSSERALSAFTLDFATIAYKT